ncbi:MAG: hypothetical protein ABI555_01290 [Chloroflexota bacterium]
MVEHAQPGLRQVALVAAAAVVVVLGAAVATGLLPEPVQRLVFHTPLTIMVLIAGTSYVLWRVASRRPPEDLG